MNGDPLLVFSCPCCNEGEVTFSLLDVEGSLSCSCCSSTYVFDVGMQAAINQFAALCSQLYQSRSILGNAVISVSVQDRLVELPFQLLFSRFPVSLKLKIAEKEVKIRFIFDALAMAVLHQDVALLEEVSR